jgi:hypothetical protein
MRRGAIAGLRWNDLDSSAQRISITRTLQSLAGTPTEFGAKTRTSQRGIDIDDTTLAVLHEWHRRLTTEGLPAGPDDWMFCNTAGRFLNPQSVTQLFVRRVAQSDLLASGSTTCAIPTRRSSLPAAHPSRSSASASVTPTQRSPCTPINTSCPA